MLVRIAGVGLAAGALAAADTSCSLIVDTNANQCTTTSDCSAFPGARTCVDGVCVTSSNCKVNADCASQGQYFICRKDTLACVNLASPDCTDITGNYADDNAFIFGSLLPTSGPDVTTGKPIEQAIEMAIGEFTSSSNGLPPAIGATANRPLVVVSCSDQSDTTTAERAATHLVSDVGVPAIIGSAFSGITISVATAVTIPAGVLLFSPSATSDAITSLLDKGLVWRTSPPDTLQAAALNLYLQTVTARLKLQTPLVAIFNKGDSYGTGLATKLEANIAVAPNSIDTTDATKFVAVNYGNPDNATVMPTNYPSVVSSTIGAGFYPQIVFILGTTEGVDNVLELYEKSWPSTTDASYPGYKPVYVFSDGGDVSDLSAYLAGGASSDLRTRISGSVPGAVGPVYSAFLSDFTSTYPAAPSDAAGTFGVAGGYDIVYLLAYSAAGISSEVGKPSLPLTTANLIAGFSRLVPTTTGPMAQVIPPGSSNINTALSALTETTSNIDYDGASGPLDFHNRPRHDGAGAVGHPESGARRPTRRWSTPGSTTTR